MVTVQQLQLADWAEQQAELCQSAVDLKSPRVQRPWPSAPRAATLPKNRTLHLGKNTRAGLPCLCIWVFFRAESIFFRESINYLILRVWCSNTIDTCISVYLINLGVKKAYIFQGFSEFVSFRGQDSFICFLFFLQQMSWPQDDFLQSSRTSLRSTASHPSEKKKSAAYHSSDRYPIQDKYSHVTMYSIAKLACSGYCSKSQISSYQLPSHFCASTKNLQ